MVQARVATALQARVAAVLRRCCSTCRGSVAAMLQHASRQRCCSSRCCGTVATGAAALLQFASRQRCDAVAARSNNRKQRTMQRWQVASAEIFVFFYSTVSKRERRARQREKRQGFETCFLALLVGKLLPVNSLLQRQLPLTVAATSTLQRQQHTNTLRQQQHEQQQLKNFKSTRNLLLST